MKKALLWLLCGVLALCLTACGGEKDTSGDGSSATQAERKVGLGSVQSVAMTDTANANVKTTVAAVVLDKEGKIIDCAVDELAFTVTLQGGIPQTVADLTTKGERGDSYIPTADEVGGTPTTTDSWADQVEDFCDFVEGKTPGEISGLAATDGHSEQIEGCDLILTDFIQAVDHAAKAAKGAKVGAGDDLHLALTATPAESATEEKPQYNVEMAAVTVADNGKITGCMTDTLETKLSVAEGIFATVSGTIQTKRQMGDGYGMKAASAIQREWYEQADAFDTFVVGQTAAELAGIKLDSEGKTDAITGCTVSVSSMQKNVVKAARKD